MREIKVWINDDRIYQTPHWIYDINVESYIKEWKDILFPECKKVNADHYIYCTKEYDDNDVLQEINIYMTPLDDETFHKRVAVAQKDKRMWVGAWHKGTSY